MNANEVRQLNITEILERIQTEEEMYIRMRINHATRPLDNPNSLKVLRRTIARLKTILLQKKKES